MLRKSAELSEIANQRDMFRIWMSSERRLETEDAAMTNNTAECKMTPEEVAEAQADAEARERYAEMLRDADAAWAAPCPRGRDGPARLDLAADHGPVAPC
jgi:hypothetical protein